MGTSIALILGGMEGYSEGPRVGDELPFIAGFLPLALARAHGYPCVLASATVDEWTHGSEAAEKWLFDEPSGVNL